MEAKDKERILGAFHKLMDKPWSNHMASIEYMDNGSIRAILALEIEKPASLAEYSPYNLALDKKQMHQSLGKEGVESVALERNDHNKDTENQIEGLLDCLIDALFLTLQSSTNPPRGE